MSNVYTERCFLSENMPSNSSKTALTTTADLPVIHSLIGDMAKFKDCSSKLDKNYNQGKESLKN